MRFPTLPFAMLVVACSSDPSTSTLGDSETWDVTTNESEGVVHLGDSTMDFRIGSLSGDLTITDDGMLSLVLRDEDGATRFEGQRTSAAALDLGVTSLSIGGTWNLTTVEKKDDIRLRFAAKTDGVDLSCDGECDDLGGLLAVTREDEASGDFGDANGVWKVEPSGDDDSVRVRIEGSEISFATNEGDIASFRWKGDSMSGTIGDEVEFAATRR